MISLRSSETIKYGIFAGAVGGLAEVAWVSLYSALTGGDPAIVARGVTTAAAISVLLPTAPVTLGITVHMMLAVLLGLALAGLWQALALRVTGVSGLYAAALAALVLVWTTNFFVILPVVSPEFVHLVPYSVSLTSKLLFAIAAAEVLRRCVVPADVATVSVKEYPSG